MAGPKYYGVAGGPEPGVYTSWAKAQHAFLGEAGASRQAFDSLGKAKAWLIEQGMDVSTIKIFQSHFAQYPGFEPESDTTFDEEFKRLAQSQDWIPNSQQYHQERTLAIRNELQNEYFEPALKEEQLSQLTPEQRRIEEEERKLRGYQSLLLEIEKEPRPTIEECVEVLQSTLVNIIDLLDARRFDTKVEVFETFQAFKAHTLQPGKRVDLQTAKEDAFLSKLLQRLSGPKVRRPSRLSGPSRPSRSPLDALSANIPRNLHRRDRKANAYEISQVRNARVSKPSAPDHHGRRAFSMRDVDNEKRAASRRDRRGKVKEEVIF